MSLFGAKPTTTQPSVFTFGAASAVSTGAPLFGSTTTSTAKPLFGAATTSSAPLFGSVAAPATSGSLFGSTGAAPVFGGVSSSAPLFGATTSTVAKPLFGSTTTSAPLFGSAPAPAGSLFSSTAKSSAPLFGGSTTTTSAPLFGAAPSGSLFGAATTAPTSSLGGGLFGSKPAAGGFGFPSTSARPGGLFGAVTAQATPVTTLQDVIQNSESLVRSLTAPDLYGDERDTIVMKLNQLLAACGVSGGYFKADQQPIAYNSNGPFYRFKAIGYNRRSEYRESDGIVALILNVNYDQLSTTSQRQKLIDALNFVCGNNTNVRTHLESVRPLPGDNSTEVLIYVTEKGKGRISSKELCAYLKQPSQEGQLKSQLCVTEIVARSSMDDAKLRAFLEAPPAGFDAQVWKQAVKENPDPERLIPYPIRGFDQLRRRQELQTAEIRVVERAIDGLKQRLVTAGNDLANGNSRYAVCRQRQKELSYRLLRCLAMQTVVQRYSVAVDVREERLESRLEALNAALVAPNQIKSRLAALLDFLRSNPDVLKPTAESPISLKDSEAAQIKKYMSRCQQALEAVVSVVNSNLNDLKIMSAQT